MISRTQIPPPLGFKLIDEWVSSRSGVRNLVWSPDGTTLAVSTRKAATRLWPIGKGKRPRIFNKQIGGVGVAWSKQNKLATVNEKGKVVIYDFSEDCLIQSQVSATPYEGISWSPDGSQLACIDFERIKLLDGCTGKLLKSITRTHIPHHIAWSPKENVLAIGYWGGAIKLLNYERGFEHPLMPSDTRSRLRWAPDGRFLAALTKDHAIRIWDTKASLNERLEGADTGKIISARPFTGKFDFCAASLFAATVKGGVSFWQTGEWEFVSYLTCGQNVNNFIFNPVFSLFALSLDISKSSSIIQVWEFDHNTLHTKRL
ncbi:MAG: WD40 repeat domain-containing protein [Abitibacteriaceae bacterium]|nr:WD40 repeat domain-containing protein [Abditibacteriaceae bacterium]MBV9868977.1 WD40 repeat domain-containing protein [Abditibacteriaceae bacterium]